MYECVTLAHAAFELTFVFCGMYSELLLIPVITAWPICMQNKSMNDLQ